MKRKHKPVVLVICDGWGHAEEVRGNAIAQAKTPRVDSLMQRWPHTLVAASGEAVGLPAGQMGNSEVGHLTIGSGRVIRQALSRQLHEISEGSFYQNETLIAAIELAKQRGAALHIMGLVSPGGVHSHQASAIAVAKLAAKLRLQKVYVHAFTDGRDTPPKSATSHLEEFERQLGEVGVGRVASVSGRYFAMDRDKRWDRTKAVYDMLTSHEHPTHESALDYIRSRYDQNEHDEFLTPVSIAAPGQDRVRIEDGDVVVFFNFRPDRARQLTHALVDADFKDFARDRVIKDLHIVTFAEYDRDLAVPVAFPKEDIRNTLAEVVSDHKLSQFHIAETEKYAHVTYFLNGGREQAFSGEDRMLIQSPKVAYYDEAPAMSATALTDAVVARLDSHEDDLIVLNYANADMVGHTGNHEATVKAIEALDENLGRLGDAILRRNGVMIMTADHGNAERNIDLSTGKPLTSHTTSPVPVLLVGCETPLRNSGGLADIAPTVLHLMDLEIPRSMTAASLIASE